MGTPEGLLAARRWVREAPDERLALVVGARCGVKRTRAEYEQCAFDALDRRAAEQWDRLSGGLVESVRRWVAETPCAHMSKVIGRLVPFACADRAEYEAAVLDRLHEQRWARLGKQAEPMRQWLREAPYARIAQVAGAHLTGELCTRSDYEAAVLERLESCARQKLVLPELCTQLRIEGGRRLAVYSGEQVVATPAWDAPVNSYRQKETSEFGSEEVGLSWVCRAPAWLCRQAGARGADGSRVFRGGVPDGTAGDR